MTVPRGEVITFYSYKGGTGRSMALANVACLLSRMDRRVLVVDWDLEAPGLHRYFQD
jgi:MinD-like ATPase involved in chromosome partitioning or flagellar assembly